MYQAGLMPLRRKRSHRAIFQLVTSDEDRTVPLWLRTIAVDFLQYLNALRDGPSAVHVPLTSAASRSGRKMKHLTRLRANTTC